MNYNSEKIDSLTIEIDELKSKRENLIYLDIVNCLHENGGCINLEKPMVLSEDEYYLPCESILLRDGDITLVCYEDGEKTKFEGVMNISPKGLAYIHDALRKETFIY